jgi:hypothetical protein
VDSSATMCYSRHRSYGSDAVGLLHRLPCRLSTRYVEIRVILVSDATREVPFRVWADEACLAENRAEQGSLCLL